MAKVGIHAYGVQVVCPLNTFRIQYRDYTDAKNPPIPHRKDTFLSQVIRSMPSLCG